MICVCKPENVLYKKRLSINILGWKLEELVLGIGINKGIKNVINEENK